ncbi:MAG: hypothetical protein K6347_06870 [Campylobacterales bacterium]
MKINETNVMNSQIQLDLRQKGKEEAIKRLASAMIEVPADSSSQAIADSLMMNSAGIGQGIRNANDAIGYMQIADGALQAMGEGALRLSELSARYNNPALGESEKAGLRVEAARIAESIGKAVDGATFNGRSVFGSAVFSLGNSELSLQIGRPNLSGVDIADGASVEKLIAEVNTLRANLGAGMNEAFSAATSKAAILVSQEAARSGLRDADVAKEYEKLNIEKLKTNATLFAMAHNTNYLATRISELLG